MATKSTKSYAEQLNRTKVMLDGLRANASTIQKRGLDDVFFDRLQKGLERSVALNTEQEKLKADLKIKTDELTNEMDVLAKLYAEAKKLVKIEFPQEQWVEFGLADKR